MSNNAQEISANAQAVQIPENFTIGIIGLGTSLLKCRCAKLLSN
jgi:hypothetical protein